MACVVIPSFNFRPMIIFSVAHLLIVRAFSISDFGPPPWLLAALGSGFQQPRVWSSLGLEEEVPISRGLVTEELLVQENRVGLKIQLGSYMMKFKSSIEESASRAISLFLG